MITRHFKLVQSYCNLLFPQIRLLARVITKHSYAHASMRIRRYGYIAELYKRLYTFDVLRSLFLIVFRRNLERLVRYRNQTKFLVSAAVLFNFKTEGISDEEMEKVADLSNDIDPHANEAGSKVLSKLKLDEEDDSERWHLVIDQPNFQMWKRPEKTRPHLCEYKCIGRIDDIPATAFFAAQLDLDYRKQWDKFLMHLEIIDKEDDGGQEVVRWITKFPYPMYPREYIFVRRAHVDCENEIMVLRARAIEHAQYPANKSAHVRVHLYHSEMVIVPHNGFDQKGFEYVATHFLDPQSHVPDVAYNYGVKYSLPGFLDEVHKAAKKLDEQKSWKGSLENWENESYWKKFLLDNSAVL